MNKEFVWTDELVKKFAMLLERPASIKRCEELQKIFEQFKASHTPEVKEVDWEITEYWNAAGHHEPNVQCERNGCKIFSVKRLSDGAVFSIGDVIDSTYNGRFTIKNIYLTHKYGQLQIMGNNGDGTPTQVIPIEAASKPLQRTPLFKTEDGVDIFSDTPIWIVFSNFEMKSGVVFIDDHQQVMKYLYKPENNKYFFSEDKAKEYVILNKPCLSVNDVIGLWAKDGYFPEKAKELARTKL